MAKKKYITKTFTYKNKRHYVRGSTEREVYEKMALLKYKLEQEDIVVSSSMLVRDWAEQCINEYKTNLKESTLYNYRKRMRVCVVDYLGNTKLKDVTPIMCQKCLNLQKGKSNWQIGQTHQMMNFIFNKAVENKLIKSNPAEYLSRPQGSTAKRRALTIDEEAIFMAAVADHPHKLYFLLQYGCGCRPGEAARVRYSDFFQRDGNTYLHIRGTKSSAADRHVPVPDIVLDALDLKDSDELVDPTREGRVIEDKVANKAWHSLKRLMNIEMGAKMYRNRLLEDLVAPDLQMYCLRHTYCTNLQKRGVDIRTAQYLMGHSDIKMTANIYTHIGFDQLDGLFSKIN